jgi:pimeloyl-ACP methyl ester carboxylesterase
MKIVLPITLIAVMAWLAPGTPAMQAPVAVAELPELGSRKAIVADDCTASKLGAALPASAIGEPVSAVSLNAPQWTAATDSAPAYCSVDGAMAPVAREPTGRPINFRVIFPAAWNRRAVQLGGGGMNGVIPGLTGGRGVAPGPGQGVVTYGSDSGHQVGRGVSPDWALNDEAIRNLGYMQMKKTHDAAIALVERMYGEKPRYNYYVGTSQGGREALTVAQRYPADYNGIIANVPIVSFSSLMLAPELIRIQEKPLATWVTRAKTNAIAAEFMRQCDGLDGLVDGIINNYMACWRTFDVKQGRANRHPWASRRCPNNVDPNPADTTAAACLTDGQISTLEFVYTRYKFSAPLVNDVRSFGMWLPNTDPSGSGLIADRRFKGQEGAEADAPVHAHLGVLGVTGFLMRDLSANPLDYAEGGAQRDRRRQLSTWLDSTSPDLAAFARRGGRMIVTIGTDDTLASPGAQLDYFQSLLDKMGRAKVDEFARLFVIPQANHGLAGRNAAVDGEGTAIPVAPIPSSYDRVRVLVDWVERDVVPPRWLVVSAGEKTLPLCSYPTFPKYIAGPASAAASYTCVPR